MFIHYSWQCCRSFRIYSLFLAVSPFISYLFTISGRVAIYFILVIQGGSNRDLRLFWEFPFMNGGRPNGRSDGRRFAGYIARHGHKWRFLFGLGSLRDQPSNAGFILAHLCGHRRTIFIYIAGIGDVAPPGVSKLSAHEDVKHIWLCITSVGLYFGVSMHDKRPR